MDRNCSELGGMERYSVGGDAEEEENYLICIIILFKFRYTFKTWS